MPFLDDIAEQEESMTDADRIVRLTAEGLTVRFEGVQRQLAAAQGMTASAVAALDTLRSDAKAAGLGRELEALEHPPAPVERKPERVIRCRVVRTFSHVWGENSYPVHGLKGAVADYPDGFVRAAGGVLEIVDPATPLATPPAPAPSW
jgi:hypothetical protein